MAWGFEVRLAIQLGLQELSVKGMIRYENFDRAFKDYMEFFYSLKDRYKDNPAKKLTIKLMLNSLYGKLG